MFAKYIRIDFQSHYGRHHYCPISLLRVHGNSETDVWNKEQEQASSTSQAVNQLNDEPNDDPLQVLSPTTESTEEDLNELSKEIRKNSEYFSDLKDELNPDRVNQENGITKSNDQDIGFKAYLDKAKRIFEHEVCPKNDFLNVKIFQDDSLIVYPGICHIAQCPVIVTETDLLSDSYDESEVDKLRGKRESTKEKPPVRKQNKNDSNGKINLPIGGPNQSTYMFLYKGILTLESTTKRYVEEQSKILKEVLGKVGSNSKEIDSITDHFTNTMGNLVCMIGIFMTKCQSTINDFFFILEKTILKIASNHLY